MKAVFKGYKVDKHFFEFTKDKKYHINNGYNYKFVIDDKGRHMQIDGSSVYDFEIVEDDDDSRDTARLKYFINDVPVEKGFFYELLGEINEADRLGVRVLSVNFEIKFE